MFSRRSVFNAIAAGAGVLGFGGVLEAVSRGAKAAGPAIDVSTSGKFAIADANGPVADLTPDMLPLG